MISLCAIHSNMKREEEEEGMLMMTHLLTIASV
jgi:hypothetical protein